MKDRLIREAKIARERAYAPYSNFKVGAALYTKSEKIYHGCNVENVSYSLTCCAERVAIFKAISEGEKEFLALAVIANTDQPVSPCGACRQVMSEFFTDDVEIYLANLSGKVKKTTINDLMPNEFRL